MAVLTPHQKAALQFDNHISLTANAGSGKTFVLSRRYIEIVLTENISLRNIAAITFTDKAASELYKKIALQIEERLAAETDRSVARKLENMRRQLVSANISTIHSFCIDILREFPVEAGLDANFSPIDEQLSTELIELSVEETFKAAILNPEEENKLKYLVRFFSSKNNFGRELSSLIKNRKNVIKIAGSIYSVDEAKAASFFRKTFEELIPKVVLNGNEQILASISAINDAVIADKSDNLLARDVNVLVEKIKTTHNGNEKLQHFLSLKDLTTTQKGDIKKIGYAKKVYDDYRNEISAVEKFFDDLKNLDLPENPEEVEAELARLGAAVIYFFNKALISYSKKKNGNSYLDYEDILLYAQEILKNDNVKKSLSEKYKYIMIDEYQDTNELQYNIFLPILDNLKRGNLFVVGDEKQSIYMFRDAELEVFSRTKSDISMESGPQYLLSLPDSFRMAPAICLFANELFKNLFADPDPMYNEVRHSDLVCARNDGITGRIELLFNGNENEGDADSGDNSNSEAEIVAKRIIKLLFEDTLPQKLKWNDVAVLCRKRKSFAELEKTFTKYKIPFTIIGGKGFYQRQVIYDIFNYFSFLLDNKNDTALIGILRSPFFSISDSEILEISLNDGKSFWEKLFQHAKSNVMLYSVVSTLKENINLSDSYDITALLRKILNESNLMAVLSSKSNGYQEIANINKLIKLTINFSSQGFKTLYDYVSFLKESIEETEDEAQAMLAEESDSVKIMTVHQSKGLEFPAVFLFNSDDKSSNYSVRSKSISINKDFGILTKVPLADNYFGEYLSAPINGIADIIAIKKSLAENKRLFYVAVTRAVNYLFISSRASNEFKYDRGSFTGMLKEGLNIDFSSEKYDLSGKLKYLRFENNEFRNVENELNIVIPIIKKVEESKATLSQESVANKKRLYLETIADAPEGEIISATKVSVFKQCPVKYQLTYEFGFGSLFHDYRSWFFKYRQAKENKSYFEYNNNEDNIVEEDTNAKGSLKLKNYADVKGRIIHEILEASIGIDRLDEVAASLLKHEFFAFENNDTVKAELGNEIISDIRKFYESNEYAYLSSFNNFKNEYQVYVKEKDYFLYGIIDKLIFDGSNSVTIVDYKTDDVDLEDIGKKSEAYFTQLKFYAYLISKLMPFIEKINLRLVFTKHPDNVIKLALSSDHLKVIGKEINDMVNLARANKFEANVDHCKSCYFALNNICVKNQ